MDSITLTSPERCHEAAVMDYKAEFERYGENIDGSGMLGQAETFTQWLEMLKDNEQEGTVREGYVPAETYLAVRPSDGRIIGMVSIRLRLNDYLAAYGGHIGYSVRSSERQKGYAKEMLRLALSRCKEKGIHKALITCDKENIPSERTILANGGVLESEVPEGDSITQRYWICMD
jgi:predicted acetyltransferase